jgi:hypothetical protein
MMRPKSEGLPDLHELTKIDGGKLGGRYKHKEQEEITHAHTRAHTHTQSVSNLGGSVLLLYAVTFQVSRHSRGRNKKGYALHRKTGKFFAPKCIKYLGVEVSLLLHVGLSCC